jgi:hypothetical protein
LTIRYGGKICGRSFPDLGHVYAQPDARDQVMRAIPLEKRGGAV